MIYPHVFRPVWYGSKPGSCSLESLDTVIAKRGTQPDCIAIFRCAANGHGPNRHVANVPVGDGDTVLALRRAHVWCARQGTSQADWDALSRERNLY